MDPSPSSIKTVPIQKRAVRIDADIHDRQQIELELTYPLLPATTCTYCVELFLFIPRNVGVSRQNYKQETFYQDLTAYLRMDTPALTLVELSDPHCSLSPLYRLTEDISRLEHDNTEALPISLAVTVKLLGHSFRESVHAFFQQMEHQIQVFSEQHDIGKLAAKRSLLHNLQLFTKHGKQVLDVFRTLQRRFGPLSGAFPLKTKETFEYIHEYISAYLIEKIAILCALMKRQTALHDGSALVSTALSDLNRVAKEVAQAREEEGFTSPDPASPRTAEFFTYRRGLIKKAMQQAFYLETRALRGDHFRRNIVAMLAAGLAAIWTLFLIPSRSDKDSSSWTSVLLVGFVVIAYMLRDRTQELARNYLGQKLHNYDHDTAIWGEHLAVLGLAGLKGRVREKMNWASPNTVPSEVTYLRTHPRTVSGADITTEEVLCYQRTLTLGLDEGAKISQGVAVRDILRLNLRHFMTRLDDPIEEISYYDLRQESFLDVESPKVYHLNLLLKVRRSVDDQTSLSRYRVVLNKERILRIEKVQPG